MKYDVQHHATTAVRWLSMPAIFHQPSIRRNFVSTELEEGDLVLFDHLIRPQQHRRRVAPRRSLLCLLTVLSGHAFLTVAPSLVGSQALDDQVVCRVAGHQGGLASVVNHSW